MIVNDDMAKKKYSFRMIRAWVVLITLFLSPWTGFTQNENKEIPFIEFSNEIFPIKAIYLNEISGFDIDTIASPSYFNGRVTSSPVPGYDYYQELGIYSEYKGHNYIYVGFYYYSDRKRKIGEAYKEIIEDFKNNKDRYDFFVDGMIAEPGEHAKEKPVIFNIGDKKVLKMHRNCKGGIFDGDNYLYVIHIPGGGGALSLYAVGQSYRPGEAEKLCEELIKSLKVTLRTKKGIIIFQ